MHISILKCGPELLFIWLRWPSVQVEFDMPGVEDQETEKSAKDQQRAVEP
jgi:hypothetical protein